jgi:hypothetical protein
MMQVNDARLSLLIKQAKSLDLILPQITPIHTDRIKVRHFVLDFFFGHN